MNKYLATTLTLISLGVVFLSGYFLGVFQMKAYTMERCMKYSSPYGYPLTWYCKLYVGDIKAMDE